MTDSTIFAVSELSKCISNDRLHNLLYNIYCCLVRVSRVVNLSVIQISASYSVMPMEIV